jgi:hypothetical protein
MEANDKFVAGGGGEEAPAELNVEYGTWYMYR